MADLTNKQQNLVDDGKFSSNFGAGPRHDKRMGIVGPDIKAKEQVQGVREPLKKVPPAKTPPKAPAAPTGKTAYLFTGLAEALNTYQNDLVKRKIYSKADVYEFEFQPASMAASKVKRTGGTDRSKTAGKQATTVREAKDPKTDKVNNNSQNWNIQAGTQIVQVIDQIMRSSEFVNDQAKWQVDPVTQKLIASPGTGTGQTVWYHISVQATALDYDDKRRDYAYRMKFIITPYAITQMASEYFPDSAYRGSHKSYNYWFTGQNTQILSYEQTYDYQYRLILSGLAPTEGGPTGSRGDQRDFRDQYTRTAMPTTEQKTGQTTGDQTPSAADNAADFRYDTKDFAVVRMRIIGDPAWIQEDKIDLGVSNQTFNFRPFNNDGGINFNSQELVFDITWNNPQDYDMETGIMDVYPQGGRSKEYLVYTVKTVKSFFTRGRFEQELEGQQLVEYNTGPKPAEVRPAAKKPIAKPPAKDISNAAPKTIVENGGGAAFVNPVGIRRTAPNPGSLSDRVQKENIRRSGLDFG